MVTKSCELCSVIMEKVHHSKKYCEKCKKESLKINRESHYNNHKENIKEQKMNELEINFFNVVKSPENLTGKGFNKVSEIKCKAYTQVYDKKWVEILKLYGVFDDLLNYIVATYKEFSTHTGKVSLREYVRVNKNCSYDLLIDIGIDLIKEKAGITKLRYTDEDFIDNFQFIYNVIGNPPLYNEFEEHTKIQLNTYATKYKLKGKVYTQLMRIMLSDEDYELYLNRYKMHKSNVGTITGILSAQYTDSDYEQEFNKIFKFSLEEYGEYPSRRLFNQLSKIDDSSYRRKYNKNWLDICKMYGYEIDRNHKSEKMVLNLIKDLTGANYSPQQTWNWLIGVGGKNMYCDGYFPSLNLVVEFDGVQHRKPVDAFGGEKAFLRTKLNDNLKNQLLKEHNIEIIRIPSNAKWYDRDFISNKLKNFIS